MAFDLTSFALGLVVGALAILVWRARRLSKAHSMPDLSGPPAPPVVLAPDVRAAALKLRAEGRLIEAIKLLRDRAGLDLKAAKDAVENLR
jgi:ribosomal protein L7/L12